MCGSVKILMGVLLAGRVAWAGAIPPPERVRAASLEHVRNSTEREGMARFTEYLGGQLSSGAVVSGRDLANLSAVADCIRFLELAEEGALSEELAAWVLGSAERLHLLVERVDSKDRKAPCLQIMDRLRVHDPRGRDEFYRLILAIALVMDSPPKHPMHGQMGEKPPRNKAGPVELYDYFKALYAGGAAKVAYEKLSVSELIFVVYLPIPVSELEWVRENVDGALADWPDKYSGIVYDRERLRGSQYRWPHGNYTLSEIKRRGGICVDQAYFAVITARAYGIPAIYFHGSGKNSNHAWFGYMEAPGKWMLDVGRYKGNEYTTGYAIDPQTWEKFTDHRIGLIYGKRVRDRDFARANECAAIAVALQKRYPETALRYAVAARRRAKLHLRAWELELQIRLDEKDCDGLLRFFGEQKKAFGEYPDILADSLARIEPVLREHGRGEDADGLARSLAGAVDDGRDDLLQALGFEKIERMIEAGETQKARKKMEQLLNDQKEGGNKVFWLVEKYVELVMESGQEHAAAKFLPGYIEKLRFNNQFPSSYERRLLVGLYTVYKKDGNERKAKEVRQQLESLGFCIDK